VVIFWEAFRTGLFGRRHFFKNTFSGVVVGVISLPLSMAFAIASGVTPAAGIYTAIVAGLCVSLMGGSLYQVAGPTGAFVPLLFSICAEYGVGGLQMATLLAGVLLIAMGFAQFGRLLKYIPTQVVVGFTSGIGAVLFCGQIGHFVGDDGGWLSCVDWPTALIGIGCVAVLLWSHRVPAVRHIPAPLLVLLLSGTLQAIFKFPTVDTIGSTFGTIPATLPRLAWPPGIGFQNCIDLLSPAIAIALLCAIESLLSAVVADGMTGTKHQPNQELIGQGIANVLSPLFGGIASTGAIARTAANVRAGASSPLSGVVCALVLTFILLFCAPLAQYIPLAALAAILLQIAFNMMAFPYLLHLLRHAPRTDMLILLATFALTVFCGLVIAVNVGVLLSALLLMQRLASTTRIECNSPRETVENIELLAHIPDDVIVYTVSGPIFFAMVEKLDYAISQVKSHVSVVILRLSAVPFVDTTAQANLRRAIQKFDGAGRKFIFCEASQKLNHKLRRAHIHDSLRDGNSHRSLKEALDAAKDLQPFVAGS
jgi:SulP family sulfate permease